jgi:hypothetical protein
MAGAGIQTLAKLRAQMCGNPRRLDRGLPRIKITVARIFKFLNRLLVAIFQDGGGGFP